MEPSVALVAHTLLFLCSNMKYWSFHWSQKPGDLFPEDIERKSSVVCISPKSIEQEIERGE